MLTWNNVEDLVIQSKIHSDTRPFKRLLKAISNFMYAGLLKYRENDDKDAIDSELLNFELIIRKYQLIDQWSKTQKVEFLNLDSVMDQNILNIQNEIENLKSQLLKAQEIKNQKIIYDSLAKSIKKISSRERSMKRIHTLERDIKNLQVENENLVQERLIRKAKFEKLITLMHNLQDEIAAIVFEDKTTIIDDIDEDEDEEGISRDLKYFRSDGNVKKKFSRFVFILLFLKLTIHWN